MSVEPRTAREWARADALEGQHTEAERRVDCDLLAACVRRLWTLALDAAEIVADAAGALRPTWLDDARVLLGDLACVDVLRLDAAEARRQVTIACRVLLDGLAWRGGRGAALYERGTRARAERAARLNGRA